MPRLIVTDSGAVEREIRRLLVVDAGGTTRDLKRLFVVDSGGTARLVFRALLVTLNSSGYAAVGINAGGGPCAGGIKVKRDGNIATATNNAGTSLTYANIGGTPNEYAEPPSPTVGDDLHLRMVTSSGALNAGSDPTDVWIAITADREFFNAHSGPGDEVWIGKLQISDDGGSTVLAETDDFFIQADSFNV